MTRWYRWYEGTCEDAKFRVTARNASVTVATVIAIWAMLLEDASCNEHRGVALRGKVFYSTILDLSEDELDRVLEHMIDVNLISVGDDGITITKWKERQFETDTTDGTNAERQRRYRAKHRISDLNSRNGKRNGKRNGDKTSAKRPETETETETDKKESKKETRAQKGALLSDDWPSDYETRFWNSWPNKVGKPAALKALTTARKRRYSFVAIMTGIADYVHDKPPDRPWLNPATFLNQSRWEDQPATVSAKNGISKRSGSLIDAIDRELEKVQREEDAAAAMPEDVVLSLPRRSVL